MVSSDSYFNVQFYAEDSLFVGYNKVFFKVTDKSSGLPLNQATIDLFPLMDMGTFKHACPVENPGDVAGTDGLFKGAVLFSMPGMNNSWSLSAIIDAEAGKPIRFISQYRKLMAHPLLKRSLLSTASATDPG